ncbi:MAG: hypothetical protein R6W93_05580, partial [Candidatus Limnocylindrales bacterium]
RSLLRLASAKEWEPPAAAASEIRGRLRSLEPIEDPTRLGVELLSLSLWALRILDRRRPGRQVVTGPIPHRRAGDHPRPIPGTA